MTIEAQSQKLKDILDREITDFDHISKINEKGIYQIFEDVDSKRVYFGLYVAHKTLTGGLKSAYKEIDSLLSVLKKRGQEYRDIEVHGIKLVSFDRLTVYHIKTSLKNC